jgi:hypothetical protein
MLETALANGFGDDIDLAARQLGQLLLDAVETAKIIEPAR